MTNKKDAIAKITNLVEESSLKDISGILNRSTELFASSQIEPKEYMDILLNIAKRADKLAQKIYDKTHSGGLPQHLDLEEYRTLSDISQECRDGVREITLQTNLSRRK